MREPIFRREDFWSDVGNILAMRSVYRKPKVVNATNRFHVMYGVHKCPLCGAEHVPPDVAEHEDEESWHPAAGPRRDAGPVIPLPPRPRRRSTVNPRLR